MTTPLYADGELIPGTVYRVTRRLSSAGLGAVYEVEDTKTAARYCLKTLDAVTGDVEAFRQRIAQEAQALGRLAHPHIVQIFSAGVTEDRKLPFLVMELLTGLTLREVLDKKGRLEMWSTLDIAAQVLDALDHAHGRGIVHRDVKPENIFLHRARKGAPVQVKLLDFGVGAFLEKPANRSTDAGFSPTYAAPEILEGQPATAASDLYSMGLVLYEMLKGKGPFDDAGDLADVARARLERPPAPLAVDVPLVLDDLVQSALERDPSLRPSDAFAFGETLRVLAARISRIPQSGVLSSEPPPLPLQDPPSGAMRALVEADWSPPLTPRPSDIARLMGIDKKKPRTPDPPAKQGDTTSERAARSGTKRDSASKTKRKLPSASSTDAMLDPSAGAGRDTMVGIALGLAILLVALVIVMLK